MKTLALVLFLPMYLLASETNTTALVKAYDNLYFGDTKADVDWRLRDNIYNRTQVDGINFTIRPTYLEHNGTNLLNKIMLSQETGDPVESSAFTDLQMRSLYKILSAKFGEHVYPAPFVPLKVPKDLPDDGIIQCVAKWRVEQEKKNVTLYYEENTLTEKQESSFFKKGDQRVSTNFYFHIEITSDDQINKEYEQKGAKF